MEDLMNKQFHFSGITVRGRLCGVAVEDIEVSRTRLSSLTTLLS
jgi:hypothetical protein